MVIGGSTLRILLATLLKHVQHLNLVVFVAHILILKEYLAADHVILSQCACFVRDQELDAAKLLRNVGVAGNASFDLIIIVDPVLVPKLGQVQIDPHTDWNNAAQK